MTQADATNTGTQTTPRCSDITDAAPPTRRVLVVLGFDADHDDAPLRQDTRALRELTAGLAKRFDAVETHGPPLPALAACLKSRPSAVVLVRPHGDPCEWMRPFCAALLRQHTPAVWAFSVSADGQHGMLGRMTAQPPGANQPVAHPSSKASGDTQRQASTRDADQQNVAPPPNAKEYAQQFDEPAQAEAEAQPQRTTGHAEHEPQLDEHELPMDGPLISEQELALLIGRPREQQAEKQREEQSKN